MRIKLGREWELGDRIGGGGFGQVYAAKSKETDAAVAKLVPKAPGGQRELLFVKLNGVRNVVPIIDSGEIKDQWVLVMPRAKKSLRQYIDESAKPLPAADAVAILQDIATALSDLDGRVVHRDLKPDNILLLGDKWSLADFGISRYAESTTAPDTQKFALSPPYAAPERWRGERATTATDVYSLGVVGYQLLAGALPFRGPELHDFREQHLHAQPPALSHIAPSLGGLVGECLYKAPGARPSPANISARLARIWLAPVSPALSRLRAADLAEVNRRSEETRRQSERQTEEERRKELSEGAVVGLKQIADALFGVIATEAPSANVEKQRNGGWTARLAEASLDFQAPAVTPRKPWGSWESPKIDVLAHGSLSIQIPPDQYQYYGRSHSLWYCDAKEAGRYQWFETAFMITPLVSRRGRQDPFALDPGEESAKALWVGVSEFQVAWPFMPLQIGELDEFIDGWISWFADAAQGRLHHPRTMPERHADGTWRTR